MNKKDKRLHALRYAYHCTVLHHCELDVIRGVDTKEEAKESYNRAMRNYDKDIEEPYDYEQNQREMDKEFE